MRAIRLLMAVALGCGALVLGNCGGGGGESGAPASKTVKILWAKWAPADALQKLGDEYKAKTGIEVFVDQKPWSADGFPATKQQEFNTNGTTYDIIVGDSQWIGQGVKGGHYAELTEVVKGKPELFKDVAPAALKFYAEYPQGSGKLYAVPCESDAVACAYRKDLFEDAKHKAGYRKFVEGLPQLGDISEVSELTVPKTWSHLLLIARYFKEASGEPNLAGIVMPTTRSYDQACMTFQPIFWSYGGAWGDYAKLKPTVDTPEAVQALTVYRDLVRASSEGGKDMDYGEVNKSFISGQAAMAMTFFAFFPAIASPQENKDFYNKVGYFNVPKGPKGQFTSLGGQGMSVNNHVSDARKKQAIAFMEWFSSPDVQKKWVMLGGFTANTQVLASEEFRKASPYNGLFNEAFGMMQDFWNIPEYDQLLESAQKEITGVVQSGKDPAAAIHNIQAAHEKVLSGVH